MKNIATFLLAFGVVTASLSAWAQGAYIGAGYGRTSVDYGACEGDISCSVDDTDSGFKIFGGYQFGPYLPQSWPM